MTRDMQSLMIRFLLIAVFVAAPAAAQAPRPVSDAQTISRGWAAIAAGRLDEAVSLADGILKKKPRSHAAFTLKIEALADGTRPIAALDAYEAWMPKSGHNMDDRGLLEPIATGMLRLLAADPDVLVRTAALEFLANGGDEAALDALRQRSTDGDQPATLALVGRGDANAISTLQTVLGSPTGRDMSTAITLLAEHGGLTTSLAQSLVKDRVPMNRAAVAAALARSKDPGAAQLLDTLGQDPDPLVRTSITLARARNGDERALVDARAMLASEVPDIRLTAAEALVATLPQESERAVRPLLSDRDGINRFRAAAIIGRSDPSAVQSVLIEGLGDKNPLIQQVAARTASQTLSGDIVLLRQLLRHSDHAVIVQAAGAIVGP
jgi:HEAT repeat protein